MSDVDDRQLDPADGGKAPDAGRGEGTRAKLSAAVESAKGASERHVALAVPIRAVERNRRVAASVLAGGLAYRLFLWLLPFGLIVGGALGLSNANDTQDAVEGAASRRRSPTRSAMPRAPLTPTRGGSSRSACPFSSGRVSRVPRRSCSFIRSSGTNLPEAQAGRVACVHGHGVCGHHHRRAQLVVR